MAAFVVEIHFQDGLGCVVMFPEMIRFGVGIKMGDHIRVLGCIRTVVIKEEPELIKREDHFIEYRQVSPYIRVVVKVEPGVGAAALICTFKDK